MVGKASVFARVGERLELFRDISADAREAVFSRERSNWAFGTFLSEEVRVKIANAAFGFDIPGLVGSAAVLFHAVDPISDEAVLAEAKSVK